MKKSAIVLVILISAVAGHAQSTKLEIVDKYKRDLLLAMVKLLAADTANYKGVPPDFCQECESAADLIAAASNPQNGLIPILDKMIEVQNVQIDITSLDKYTADVNDLGKKLEDFLIGKRHPERAQLPVYPDFLERLSKAKTATIQAYQNINTVQAKPAVNDNALPDYEVDHSVNPPDSAPAWLYFLLFISLGIAVYALLHSRRVHRNFNKITQGQQDISLNDLVNDIENIQKVLKQPLDGDKILRGEMAEIRKNMAVLLEELNSMKKAGTADSTNGIAAKAELHDNLPAGYLPEKTFYTSYPDAGNGFSLHSLREQPFAEGLYIIDWYSNNKSIAFFRISENEAAQKKALQYPGLYLDNACDMEGRSPDLQNAIIELKTAGQLSLDGNVWRITRKAVIQIV